MTDKTDSAALVAGDAERVSGQPVAWRYHYPDAEEFTRLQLYEGMSCHEEAEGMIETPLYARPVSAELTEARAEIARLRGALEEAIDVLDGMNDDEINAELLPRLRAALKDTTP